ncbi:MAG: sulfatase-like hydrolase/transferase [Planctomycetota bacterium]
MRWLLAVGVIALAPVAQPPNSLVVLADDLGIENLAVYGSRTSSVPPPTPTIDALAARGVLFRNFWSQPECTPTRASLMTGRYAMHNAVGSVNIPHGGTLELAETTFAEHLADASYAAAAFGKWHLSYLTTGARQAPNLQGFTQFAGTYAGAVDPSYYSYEYVVNGSVSTSTTYNTTQIVDDAIAWLATAPEPWVCYVAFNAPHSPYHAPPSQLHSYDLEGLDPTTDPIPFYKAMIEAMDTELGRLLGALGPTTTRTDVWFLGDNGTPDAVVEAPLRPARVKSSAYEGGVNVPLIVAGPSVGAPGRTEGGLAHVVDLFATLADTAGLPPCPKWLACDGRSLRPYLQSSGGAPVRDAMVSERFIGLDPNRNGFACIRGERFKLIRRYPTGQEEYYDLSLDPMEQSDLLAGSLSPAQLLSLEQLRNELTVLRAARSQVELFGTAQCAGSNGNPRLSVRGLPTIGQSHAIALADGATTSAAVLLGGASRASLGAVPLPLALATLGGGPRCSLYTSYEAIWPTLTDGSGDASLTMQVPDMPILVGATMHHTWLVLDPTAPENPLGLTASDAARTVFGRP